MSQKTIPTKPTDTSHAGFVRWVQEHFPYEQRWYAWLQSRGESDVPKFGSAESLDDLRGIGDRDQAALCAAHWWNTFENLDRILREHAAAKREEQQRERKRLIALAKQAVDGKLGETSSARDDARSTAQTFLRQVPEQCSDDDLSDWMKMHQYAKRLATGARVSRPLLEADLRKKAAADRELRDIDVAIGGDVCGRPSYSQQALGGGW